jgi:hypothetical protein
MVIITYQCGEQITKSPCREYLKKEYSNVTALIRKIKEFVKLI